MCLDHVFPAAQMRNALRLRKDPFILAHLFLKLLAQFDLIAQLIIDHPLCGRAGLYPLLQHVDAFL